MYVCMYVCIYIYIYLIQMYAHKEVFACHTRCRQSMCYCAFSLVKGCIADTLYICVRMSWQIQRILEQTGTVQTGTVCSRTKM
jgi:hypothetical protein